MLLLENVKNSTDHNRSVSMTHQTNLKGTEHTISFFKPDPSAGPFAGELIARYVLSTEQAKELKAHL